MTKKVVGIRFKKAGKIYYFDPMNYKMEQYDHVVVETVQGMEYGEVALPPRTIDEGSFSGTIKPVLRKATPEDEADYARLKEKEKAARTVFEEKVALHRLNMKLINVEYTFDKKKAIFYFTADGRVDFRNLVKDLAAVFRVRIELRQIGVRDEAKIFNTLGVCGRSTCCSQWLGDFTPVSIKMAKEQNMSLNSTKISGICGRLLCCLTYEHEFYKDVTKRMPKVGQMVETPDGIGQVFRLGVLQESVMVRMQIKDNETEIRIYPMDEVKKTDQSQRPPQRNDRNTGDKREGTPGDKKGNNRGPQNRKPGSKNNNRGEKPTPEQPDKNGGNQTQSGQRGQGGNTPKKDRGWDNRQKPKGEGAKAEKSEKNEKTEKSEKNTNRNRNKNRNRRRKNNNSQNANKPGSRQKNDGAPKKEDS